MAWPLSQDYNEAVQDPALAFADDELRAGQVVTNALGLPMPRSGTFADVYEVRAATGGRRWAVKCFTGAVPGHRERYAAISAHLARTHPWFGVDFQYLEQGIRVHGRWYPVLKMDWVEGLLLNEFVRQHLDRPAMLETLARLWAKLARRLRRIGVAHGDLQHGNVLLVPGRDAKHLALKLIDYDGMYVPALAGRPSGEVGHPAYQHPRRLREATYSAEVDRFPLLAVYVAIRALMVGGRPLWERYDNGDNLLFRPQDLEAPTRSPLFHELLKLNDPTLRVLVEKLIDAARRPLEQTPLLRDLLAGRRTGVKPAMPYASELSRTNPSCLLFLIDQSSSMVEPFGAQPDRPKADGVADSLNRLLQNLVLKCAKADGVRDYFHVGVVGYGGRVAWALGGALAGQKLVPVSAIANAPLRVEQRMRKIDDGAGGLVEQRFKFPVWLEPVAGGRTPMCQALTEAAQALEGFIARYPHSFPPLVLNISDGKATDGNPEVAAAALRRLATSDGEVLLFNAHLSSVPARPIEFPSRETDLPDPDAQVLFRMSTILPPRLQIAAQNEGYRVDDRTRGFVFNADLVSVIRFLDIGTRVAQSVR
jgi:serine/threonine protein kinase